MFSVQFYYARPFFLILWIRIQDIIGHRDTMYNNSKTQVYRIHEYTDTEIQQIKKYKDTKIQRYRKQKYKDRRLQRSVLKNGFFF